MIQDARSSETSAVFKWATKRYILEDTTLHSQRCENLKSCIAFLMLLEASWKTYTWKKEKDMEE
jgi:hypothetical protein